MEGEEKGKEEREKEGAVVHMWECVCACVCVCVSVFVRTVFKVEVVEVQALYQVPQSLRFKRRHTGVTQWGS